MIIFIIFWRRIFFDHIMRVSSNLPITLAVLFKLGTAPFFSWFISSVISLSILTFFLILTLQKIIPFLILNYSHSIFEPEVCLIVCARLIIGSISNIRQKNLKMLLILSRVVHAAWFIRRMRVIFNLWLFYFISYASLLLIFLPLFNVILSRGTTKRLKNKESILFFFMRLRGLPPFLMFMPKILTIYYLRASRHWLLIITLVARSIIDFFVYLRITYSVSFLYCPNKIWSRIKNKKIMSIIVWRTIIMWTLAFFL